MENEAIGGIVSIVLMILNKNWPGFSKIWEGLGDYGKAIAVLALYILVGFVRCLVLVLASTGTLTPENISECAGTVFELASGGATAWITLRKIIEGPRG